MASPLDLSAYDIIWKSPSENATGSMPIGNGDLAANVWVEPNGDLLLLIAKGDAWDENSSLVKLGRVRVRLDPPLRPADDGEVPFCQRLVLEHGMISIRVCGVLFRIWPDADAGAIHLHAFTEKEHRVQAVLETWRNYPYRMTPTQTGDLFKNLTGKDPYPTMITPDVVDGDRPGEIVVYHANSAGKDDPFLINLELQGLGGWADRPPSPLAARVFGMAVRGRGYETVGERTIRSLPATDHQIDIYGLTLHPTTPQVWQAELRKRIDTDTQTLTETFARNTAWWQAFWDRSCVVITSFDDDDNAYKVTRAYVLQRYLNACCGRGEFPIKHNGSLFTVGRPWDPDFRRWGGPGFWFMNQRLVYWPMLADGDFDMMRPWLAMYRKTLELQRHRTSKYFGHTGAHFPETMTFWGAEVSGHYGWTPFEERERPEAECAYLTYYWSGAVELILIMAEFVAHTGDDTMTTRSLIPIADAVTEFYDLHYPRLAGGRIRFEPAQALETWHRAVDPMPEVAGLRYTLDRLLSLGIDLPETLVARCHRILADLPPLPMGVVDGQTLLLPAAKFDLKKNTESPELYCIYPYRLFGVGKPDLDLARRTFARRLVVEHTCWHQDVIQMALLGLTDQAKDFVSRRAADDCHSDSRFPAFWNAHHDWIPDIDHGGVLQIAVQNMLVQCDGATIRLLPAWPGEWDVDFKLHVSGPAVIEGRVRGGKIEAFAIDPPYRRGDVIFPLD